MAKIYGGTVTTPMNPEMFGGSGGGSITVDQTYDAGSKNAQSGKAVAEAIAGAEYFNVAKDGVLSLKNEYQSNGLLPENLIIPNTINGIKVTSLSDGMFENNSRVVTVTLPSTITTIPQNCFKNTIHLLKVLNAGNIVNVGNEAFHTSHIEKIELPALTVLGTNAFNTCPYLETIDIGRVTIIPEGTFRYCESLKEIVYSGTITSVGDYAFYINLSLKEIGFANTLTSIGKSAFFKSSVRFDWSTLTNCTFGDYATPYQFVNGLTSDEYGKSSIPYQNPIVESVNQGDIRWKDEPINSSKNFSDGCLFFSTMNAYCGLHNKPYSNPFELKQINNAISDTQLENFTNAMSSQQTKDWIENLGFVADVHTGSLNNPMTIADFDKIKAHLRNGYYCIVIIPSHADIFNGSSHAVLLYGVNEYDEVLFVNSSSKTSKFDEPVGLMGSCLLQNFVTILDDWKSGYILLKPILKEVNLPLIDKRIDNKVNSATGTFTPTNDTSEFSISGLNFRPTEISIIGSIPNNIGGNTDVNAQITIFDKIKEPIEKYGGVMVIKTNGTSSFVNIGTTNTFKFYNDGFYFNRTTSVFKEGYTYTWYATGKRNMIAEGCFVLNEDADEITIDFGSVDPKTFTIFAEKGMLTPTESTPLIRTVTLNKPSEVEGVTNDTNVFLSIKKYGNQIAGATFVHKVWETTLQNGHYRLQLSVTNHFDGSNYKFAKGVVYRWVAVS